MIPLRVIALRICPSSIFESSLLVANCGLVPGRTGAGKRQRVNGI
jgi:hypothetical protein